MPRGLRSFDEHDAGCFLSLLPGARGRDGLPESVRFWKSHVEETAAESTFSVGIVYGPSGCGKSSLVRAGVIPQLEETVTAVYVEATPEDTESRIIRAVSTAVGSGSENQTLVELFQTIRRQGRKKVVVFVDQFEQWLQSQRDLDSELVQALRQCDCGRLQAVVMLRDDFWLAASRFMRELDVRIKEGDNSNFVDLFPISHAERVLTLFAQARGDLPRGEDEFSAGNRAFVRDAVESLAQEDKVICVRLALFAEMMRGRQWIPETLEKLGGTSGIGLTFLEETFSSPAAPIEHRVHQAAARNVLRALLPVAGTQLKGHMVPVDQLREDSGYGSLPAESGELDSDFIVQAIRTCGVTECANIVKAITPAKDKALTAIQTDFRAAIDRKDIRTATRLAIVALCFGDTDAGLVLLRIPAGKFSRFDVNAWEARRHWVTFDRDLWVSDREVSVEQYRKFIKQSASLVGWTDPTSSPEYHFPGAGPGWPMQNVTWFEAVAFCNWLSDQEGLDPAYLLTDRVESSKGVSFKVENQTAANGFRLPTEAE